MSDKLDRAEAHVGKLMDDILSIFHPGMKITVLVRDPLHDDRDFMMTSDDPAQASRMIDRRIAAISSTSRGQAFDGEGEADSSKTCLTCNGFGLARGGACWNCKGSGKERGEAVNPDTARLDALRDECWDLRCFSVQTGGDDADVAWKVVGHWMAEPQERTIAEGWSHDPRVAIDAALSSAKRGEG